MTNRNECIVDLDPHVRELQYDDILVSKTFIFICMEPELLDATLTETGSVAKETVGRIRIN
jgi:hypothetical protein